eukprot:CAMPEP_0113446006 /NCGR_PEP_ID=MMETSP0014_2-20120614/3480_1 /TAXON_ID=2857 /ORGANISM="Nitzschia sp." /LENGTH=531 /DNA_ID=CAMNT_0000337077 /DNA_START=41 /DNA_END=1636 /DNA_ORIENTATION=+ /assembly_acc=CAM_ASM_000159
MIIMTLAARPSVTAAAAAFVGVLVVTLSSLPPHSILLVAEAFTPPPPSSSRHAGTQWTTKTIPARTPSSGAKIRHDPPSSPQSSRSSTSSTSSRLFSSYAPPSSSGPRLDIDLNENAYRDISTFQQWALERCGIQTCDGFQLYDEDQESSDDGQPDQQNMGIMTSVGLEENSPVVFVPSNVILSSTRIKQEEFGTLEEAEKRLVSAKASDHVPQFYVFLKILLELQAGQQSPYYAWFNSLPRYYSNGSSMTPFCFECLPPLAGFLAQKERIQYIQFFQALKYIDFLDPNLARNKEITKWAFAVVYTRGFSVERMDGLVDYKLIPMVDYFNHCSNTVEGPEVYIQYDEDENAYGYTTRSLPPNTPLRLQYGDPTNPSHLLARYGFLDKESPATFCKIMISKPTMEQINMGYDHSKMLFYRDTGDVSPEVYDVLLYQLLGNELQDFNTQRAFYEAHMTGDYQTKQSIQDAYWGQTQQALLEHVDTFLQDLEKLGQKGFGRSIEEHPRLPLILSHNEFVKETFLNVRSNLMSQQ